VLGKLVELMELMELMELLELGDLGGDLKGELRVEIVAGLGDSVMLGQGGVPAQGSS
jgi:hypothetical protein